MRRALKVHWPALLVASACVGIGLSVWFTLSLAVAATLALAALGVVLCLDGPARLGALAAVVAALGLAWGSLRMGALDASVLAERIGETGQATLVTVAAARRSPWSTRAIAVVREFRHDRATAR